MSNKSFADSHKIASFPRKSASSPRKSARSAMRNDGYTFIEMVVSLGIILVIATVAITYSRGLSDRALLLRTQGQIVGLFNHAKALSQNFLLDPPPGMIICSYGVHVDSGTHEFIVFRDLVLDTESCKDDANYKYDAGQDEGLSGQLNNLQIDTSVLELFGSTLVDVVFVPPDPIVIINEDEDNNDPGFVTVRLKAIGAQSNQFTVTVNKFAQVTTQ